MTANKVACLNQNLLQRSSSAKTAWRAMRSLPQWVPKLIFGELDVSTLPEPQAETA